MNDPKTIACLAGDGVGPELMAATMRTLDRVAELHSLELLDVHLPFAGEALTRLGHPLPPTTRATYRISDAILVAVPHGPAFEGVQADLELAWHIARVQVGLEADVVVIGPVGVWANELAIERAFVRAASRYGRLVAVGSSEEWRSMVEAEHGRWGGMVVESLTMGEALVRLSDAPAELDIVLTEAPFVYALADAATHLAGSVTTVAHAWLSEDGPGLFAPRTSESRDVAGFGIADPTGMLLTASLLLAEGLQRRSAARTLERAVGAVLGRNGGAPGVTQSFTDAVIDALPESRMDLELSPEALG